MKDYKHLDREGLMRVLGEPMAETRNDGWGAAFWSALERLMVWVALFWLGIAALWAIGAAFGFYFETIALGFETGRAWMRWLWETPR